MISDTNFHPIIDYFSTEFQNKSCRPSGTRCVNMDELIIKKEVNLTGSYLVCAATIKLVVEELISIKGPGGGLIAATEVELKAPNVILSGDLNEPIQIVAIQNLAIHATDLKIKNVILYLFDDANFSIYAKCYSTVENVRIVKMTFNDHKLEMNEVACWKDYDAMEATFCILNKSLKS